MGTAPGSVSIARMCELAASSEIATNENPISVVLTLTPPHGSSISKMTT